ncbi:hypothetical protein DPMN_105458 [Dreissena polymorpha]|uniref:Uncharacterized protein n=1 Tax=Dreissena polymorpha TaxID=45954 RepID=A0A9D4HBU7_DREPO|nr:hypothetical protein DPMN_105458 [Dreissena polymorpha]
MRPQPRNCQTEWFQMSTPPFLARVRHKIQRRLRRKKGHSCQEAPRLATTKDEVLTPEE